MWHWDSIGQCCLPQHWLLGARTSSVTGRGAVDFCFLDLIFGYRFFILRFEILVMVICFRVRMIPFFLELGFWYLEGCWSRISITTLTVKTVSKGSQGFPEKGTA